MSLHLQPEANLDDRVAASARLLEDMAQTCAVLRAACLEQASLLRELSRDAAVLGPVGLAERALAQQLYIQRPHIHAAAARGDALAFLGAVVFAGYLLIGRFARPRLDNISYSTAVYAVCALALIGLSFLARQALLPVSGRDLLVFLGLALVCTLGGHLLFNWTLRYLPAAVVSASSLGEPVLAAPLAWPTLGQVPPVGTAAGAP